VISVVGVVMEIEFLWKEALTTFPSFPPESFLGRKLLETCHRHTLTSFTEHKKQNNGKMNEII
jgi:hypothetical protein